MSALKNSNLIPPADRFRRMMDLRDVVNGGDAGIELAERAEQDRDVDILRPIDRGEFAQDKIEIVNGSVRIAIVEQNAVGKEAAQRGLELVMMRIDEARHDDHAFGIQYCHVTRIDVRADRGDLVAFYKH